MSIEVVVFIAIGWFAGWFSAAFYAGWKGYRREDEQ